MRRSKQDLMDRGNSLCSLKRCQSINLSMRLLRVKQRTVYQFDPVAMNSFQKTPAENLGVTTTDPPLSKGARNPARSPWTYMCRTVSQSLNSNTRGRGRGGRRRTWNNGMTRYVLSAGVSLYVLITFLMVV